MSKVFKFVIDAGHGPNTAGKRSPRDIMREYTFNSHVAVHVMNILKAYDNVECHFVHRDDRDVPLAERVRNANNLKADAYFSIHANAHGDGKNFTSAEGVETWVGPNASEMSKRMANILQSKMVKIANQKNRGVKTGNLQVVNPRNIKVPSILLEAGFMTNEKELGLLMSVDYKVKVAYAIVETMEECFGIKKRPVPQPAPTPVPQPTPTGVNVHTLQAGETFWSLSRKYGVTVAELQAVNPNLNPATLKVGYRIAIPTKSIIHTVAKGETFWGLGRKYGVAVIDIQKANPTVNPTGLTVGTKLVIPSK